MNLLWQLHLNTTLPTCEVQHSESLATLVIRVEVSYERVAIRDEQRKPDAVYRPD